MLRELCIPPTALTYYFLQICESDVDTVFPIVPELVFWEISVISMLFMIFTMAGRDGNAFLSVLDALPSKYNASKSLPRPSVSRATLFLRLAAVLRSLADSCRIPANRKPRASVQAPSLTSRPSCPNRRMSFLETKPQGTAGLSLVASSGRTRCVLLSIIQLRYRMWISCSETDCMVPPEQRDKLASSARYRTRGDQ